MARWQPACFHCLQLLSAVGMNGAFCALGCSAPPSSKFKCAVGGPAAAAAAAAPGIPHSRCSSCRLSASAPVGGEVGQVPGDGGGGGHGGLQHADEGVAAAHHTSTQPGRHASQHNAGHQRHASCTAAEVVTGAACWHAQGRIHQPAANCGCRIRRCATQCCGRSAGHSWPSARLLPQVRNPPLTSRAGPPAAGKGSS